MNVFILKINIVISLENFVQSLNLVLEREFVTAVLLKLRQYPFSQCHISSVDYYQKLILISSIYFYEFCFQMLFCQYSSFCNPYRTPFVCLR